MYFVNRNKVLKWSIPMSPQNMSIEHSKSQNQHFGNLNKLSRLSDSKEQLFRLKESKVNWASDFNFRTFNRAF